MSFFNQPSNIFQHKSSAPLPALLVSQSSSFRTTFANRSSNTKNFGTLGSDDVERERGSVGKNSPDYFQFKLTKRRSVSLTVTNAELISKRYIRGEILNSRKSRLKDTDNLKAPLESDKISTKLDSGTYYVRIVTNGNKIYYNFTLKVS